MMTSLQLHSKNEDQSSKAVLWLQSQTVFGDGAIGLQVQRMGGSHLGLFVFRHSVESTTQATVTSPLTGPARGLADIPSSIRTFSLFPSLGLLCQPFSVPLQKPCINLRLILEKQTK